MTAIDALAAGTQVKVDLPSKATGRGGAGAVMMVPLSELLLQPMAYTGQAVRTSGVLSPPQGGAVTFSLKESLGGEGVAVVPYDEIKDRFDADAFRLVGSKVEVVGVFDGPGALPGTGGPDRPAGRIGFWRFGPFDDAGPRRAPRDGEMSLEDLRNAGAEVEGKTVRVRGQFRGRNLDGDLPRDGPVSPDDWVIADAGTAVWVTGKRPKGSGWELDPGTRRDFKWWVEVTGRVLIRQGVIYIRASEVRLSGALPRE